MPRPNSLVETIQTISPLTAAQPLGIRTIAAVPVRFTGGQTASLDVSTRQGIAWHEILSELMVAGEPVYVEQDPTSRLITELLLPDLTEVISITAMNNGDQDIIFRPSHAHHYLRKNNPDFLTILDTLRQAEHQKILVLVTETLRDHEIIDARLPAENPHGGILNAAVIGGGAVGPAIAPGGPGGPPGPVAAAPPITMARASQLFNLAAAQSCIALAPAPACITFLYPDDGCYARAHEMCRLILAAGDSPGKAWNYGSLYVDTKNHPSCRVTWIYHVAPTVEVSTSSGTETYILDPSMYGAP